MLTHRELKAMPEWIIIGEVLGKLFAEHSASAISEEKDIGNVRYHKGWVDAINEFIDMLERLFPEPHQEEPIPDVDELGERFITVAKDGSVY